MIGPSGPRFFASLNNEGSGAPNGAKGRELHPLPGTAPAFMTKAGHLPVLHYTDCRDFHLNPARASASWNHRMQTTMGFPPTISPVPVQPAPGSPNTCRTGMMPRPSANGSDEPLSAEPAPAPSVRRPRGRPSRSRLASRGQLGLNRNFIKGSGKNYFGSGSEENWAVMAGLVPAIHDFEPMEDVDARHTAGHDGANPSLPDLIPAIHPVSQHGPPGQARW